MENEFLGLKTFFSKMVIPSLVALSMKVAIMTKHQKVSWFDVVVSFISGIGTTYLLSGMIMRFSIEWIPLLAAITAISGEKIATYFVYRFKVEELLSDFIKRFTSKN